VIDVRAYNKHTYVFLKGCTTGAAPFPAEEDTAVGRSAWLTLLTDVEKCLDAGARERWGAGGAAGCEAGGAVWLFARNLEVVWLELK
jgi:hypothetical protein